MFWLQPSSCSLIMKNWSVPVPSGKWQPGICTHFLYQPGKLQTGYHVCTKTFWQVRKFQHMITAQELKPINFNLIMNGYQDFNYLMNYSCFTVNHISVSGCYRPGILFCYFYYCIHHVCFSRTFTIWKYGNEFNYSVGNIVTCSR